MTEQHRPTPNARELLQIKDELVARFQQLPAEHQATMALVLVKQVMEGEWGHWMREAIKLRWQEATEPLRQTFPITSVSRAHLKETDFTNEEIGQLTDEDMTKIARIMEQNYVETGFWDDLADAIRQVLAEKRRGEPATAVEHPSAVSPDQLRGRKLLDKETRARLPKLYSGEREAAIRESILINWRRLPPDAQAGVLVEQLRNVLGSEQGASLRRELGLKDEPPPGG